MQDLPIFSRILNNELSLSEYVINSGICKALGVYFAESNWRIDRSYLLKSLVLDNNNIADVDFAQILSGLQVQGKLQKITYARNNFGLNSSHQLE